MSKTHVPLDQTRDNPHQPRLDVGDIESLAETILEHGLRQLPEGRNLERLMTTVEEDGHEWQLKTLGEGSYEAMVQVSGTSKIKIAEGSTPADALQSAYNAAKNVRDSDIGTVVPSDVDILLSAGGQEMWDEDAAEEASIASLLAAYRVAGARQEPWRTELIEEVKDIET